ncbi:MAG: LamG-like jellyroll fold domain-containing protein [Verrucomicrobiota bacterium]
MQSRNIFLRPAALPATLLILAGGFTPLWAAPQLYDFNHQLPAELSIFGSAYVSDTGSHDNSGYLSLTDAVATKAGGVRFPAPAGNLDQIRVKFKARISDGSQADGFSFTVSPDLPAAAGSGETGYKPNTANPPRFIVAFDTFSNGGSDFVGISVIVNGKVIADIPTGVDTIPPLYNDAGEWADVDINLKRSGKLTLVFGGVTLLENIQTGFEGIDSARIGLDARTGTNFETHWFDDISIDFTDGDAGPLAIGAESELASLTKFEGNPVRFSVVPTGTGPFTYQWSRNGTPIDGETRRVLHLAGALADAASYSVRVSNGTGDVSSTPAVLTITPDLAAPQLVQTTAVGGTVNQITLVFDEKLDSVTAGEVTHYDAGALAILSATLGTDGKTVVLTTAPQQNGQNYTLKITGLKDRSVAGNPLTANAAFTGQAVYKSEVLSDSPVRYWQFEESEGSTAASVASGANTDPAVLAATFQSGEFTTVTPALLASQAGGKAVALSSELGQWLLVPNATDINSGGPYAKKTVELWIRPTTVPAPEISGVDLASLWEEGGGDRGLNLYLWKNPENTDPDTVSLVFHAYNRLADGGGSPFGLTAKPAVYAEYPGIKAEQVYHIAAVLDGDNTGTNGNLILYVNGLEVKRAPAAGQLYGHGSDIRIGSGNGRIHTSTSGALASFDGVIDEVAHYNKALSAERVAAHYFIGTGASNTGTVTIEAGSDLAAKTTAENSPVEFSVTPGGNGPFTYQWYLNGTALPGQTSRTLSLTGAAAQAGSYTVKVANGSHSVTSAPAVLTVTPDLTPAAVTSVAGLAGHLNQVLLTFSEPVDPVTAAKATTYTAAGLTVVSATLWPDGKTVTVLTSAQQKDKDYTFAISGLRDLSAAGNALTLSVPFKSAWDYRYEILADAPVRYWQFNEGVGATSASAATGLDTDPVAVSATLSSGEFTGTGSLLPSDPDGFAAALDVLQAQYIKVPNGSDLNATKGPWAKKTIELWFNANTLPPPGAEGLAAAYGLWEQGQFTRDIAVYLWRNPEDQDPGKVSLVFHAFNDSATDGPGSPFGLSANPPVFVEYKGIQAAKTYHVTAVFDGDSTGTSGNLILYVNGVEAGRTPGAGQIYNHTGDVQIGQGNGLIHSLASGTLLSFDGTIDEVAHYNTALSAERVAAHYQTGSTPSASVGGPVIRNIKIQDSSFVITWTGGGILQWANVPGGPYFDIPSATSPYTDPIHTSASRFYRLIVR